MIRHYKDKIHLLSDIIKNRENIKNEQEQTILITGCFDILHPGHIGMFQEAKELGGKVFVGIKSNDAIHISEKGITGRPFNDENERALVVSGIESVDYVFVYDDSLSLIEEMKPTIVVKGPDHNETVQGKKEKERVESLGGKFLTLGPTKTSGTTGIIQKIIAFEDNNNKKVK
ncbi:adenylyltransferase/cytidyltransferase family protein [Candidatus Woesearchaeota archaeon]|jgi:rfaE bifunctional protein nucleotidyltransferase chain/domain|nr:adenylyltransferase/cytidyltransferase family protein [Candidatus Woesearchaeota archaeon]MBT5397313.1 adenylyltransferase/cytidyltransferase family protein [Candidatus Woesearchaeota archaeon]MBT5924794.1 adenylyltransferase/cytidyltransferase family protein [Candidatus Woesearchaeota archaeon]MBT6367842.1 adenylyltransferase/cytidyltransferase family protein [Candidatus Woesearchaeota archaeon]MBT7762713.1 adenylyltransferase/cytidyltransferase family protein [Candidatus Woesearchaeota arc